MKDDSAAHDDAALFGRITHRFGAAIGIGAGIVIGLAWWTPGTLLSAALGWLGAFLTTAVIMGSARPFRDAYLASLVAHTMGFYWLAGTISQFGGFPLLGALLIFAFFVVVSALRFPLAVLFARALAPLPLPSGLAYALGWVSAEIVAPRIFPWYLGHTQLGWSAFAQIADLGGAPLISLVMIWAASALVPTLLGGAPSSGSPLGTPAAAPSPARAIPGALALVAALIYGSTTLVRWREEPGLLTTVALVQGNIPLSMKHDPRETRRAVERYLDLSRTIAPTDPADDLLIVWPETVVMDWLPSALRTAGEDPRVPYVGTGAAQIFGTLSAESTTRFFNSVFALHADGTIAPPYHKRILMPFGEFTPFGSYLPWLKELNSTAPDFTAGSEPTVFQFARQKGVAPLICYEDVVPALAREATERGANLLVNLTNDAWFGRSVAPYQHHLIASFRAIENRRYLLRATNTGLTAVVNHLGVTECSLPIFTEGVLRSEVKLLREKSVYTRIGYRLWDLVVFGVLAATALRWLRRGRAGRRAR